MASLALLLIFAHIVGSVVAVVKAQQPSPDAVQPVPCNSCCQGLAGTTGRDGRDGLRGEVGIKGDIGGPGPMGEMGPPGPHGPLGTKGDRGMQGAPGKVGPKGSHGHAGTDGQPGLDGQPGADGQPGFDGQAGPRGPKGNEGDMPRVQKSAFSVFKTSPQTGEIRDVLTFDHAEINVGSDFNLATNKFTCEIAGVYVLTFTITSSQTDQDPYIELVKDNARITAASNNLDGESSVSNHHSTSRTAIVDLDVGNQVWLRFNYRGGEQVYSSSHKYTSFSGFLLYAD